MKKILFLIHDLGHGGAEKVLVNLVNSMDKQKFDVTVMTLFDEGVNKQYLSPEVHYKTCFKKALPGNSHIMKLFSPEYLHKKLIKDKYDIEVSYLEGPSARVISGCTDKDTKKVCFIHCTLHNENEFARSFRGLDEAKRCYMSFDKIAFVSRETENAFLEICPDVNHEVIYNTLQSDDIRQKSNEAVDDIEFSADEFKMIGVGKVTDNKGFDRLAEVHKRLICEGYAVHTYILGQGEAQEKLEKYVSDNGISDTFTFIGYRTNPYKYVKNCDLFVCSSHSEGFSTAATESLIVGTPVVTTKVSGMAEMLGECGEYGIITENDTNSLYKGIKMFVSNKDFTSDYKEKAILRGKRFSTEETVGATQKMFENL